MGAAKSLFADASPPVDSQDEAPFVMPTNVVMPYEQEYWDDVKILLSRRIKNGEQLDVCNLKYLKPLTYLLQDCIDHILRLTLKTKSKFQYFNTYKPDFLQEIQFFDKVLPAMQHAVLRIEELFPKGLKILSLPHIQKSTVWLAC